LAEKKPRVPAPSATSASSQSEGVMSERTSVKWDVRGLLRVRRIGRPRRTCRARENPAPPLGGRGVIGHVDVRPGSPAGPVLAGRRGAAVVGAGVVTQAVGLDLLLAELLGVRFGVADGLLAQVDLLHRDGLLGHVDALLVEGHRGLVVAELGVDVGGLLAADGLTLDADLLAGDRDLDGLGVLDDVLAQADLAGLDVLLVDVQALLRADHRVAFGAVAVGDALAVVGDVARAVARDTGTGTGTGARGGL